MSRRPNWLLAGAALTLFAGTGAAIAQTERAAKDVHVHPQGPGGQAHGMHMVNPGDRAQHMKDVLQLRTEQEPALTAFLEATRPGDGAHRMMQSGAGAMTTPERLAAMERRMVEHQAAMRARIQATRTFYAQLDAKQKKAFDAMPMMMAGPHGKPMMAPHAMPPGHPMPAAPVPPARPNPPSDR